MFVNDCIETLRNDGSRCSISPFIKNDGVVYHILINAFFIYGIPLPLSAGEFFAKNVSSCKTGGKI